MSIELVLPSNHLILCHLLLPPSIFPSTSVFSNESVLPIRWPKYWSFSFSISHSNKYLGLISLRIDWFHLLAVQGTLKSLLQHHSSKASFLWPSAFFIVQLSYPYMTTGKTTALTRWTFVGKLMSLLFDMLSRLVIAFFPKEQASEFHGYHYYLEWFWSSKKLGLSQFPLFLHLFSMKWWDWIPWSLFFECWVLSQPFSLSSFTFFKRLFSPSLLSAFRVMSFVYLRLLTFLLAVLIPPFASSSPAFHTMSSAYKLNKRGGNI